MLAKNGTYKLCDFGSCVEGPQSLKTKEDRAREVENVLKRTTAMYRSPELADVEGTAMFGSGELTEAVDIWAMGCILYTMAFFKPPFPPDGLRTERYTIPETSKYSADVHTLIKRMLTADVELRATLDHVMECIDEMMENRPIPPLPRNSGASSSPKKKAAPSTNGDKKPAAGGTGGGSAPTRDSSFGSSGATATKKTTEARKESVPASKPAMDLLDMDFNPTISTGGGTKPAADAWNAPPSASPSDGFANFANFASPSAASGSDGGKRMDAFGFPVSPVKQQQGAAAATPAFGFAAPMPVSTPLPAAPAVDPFAELGPIHNGGAAGHAPAPMMQGFNQGFHHQPPAQQQQGFYGQQPQGFYPPQQQHQAQGFHQQQQQQQMWQAQQQQHQQQQQQHQQQSFGAASSNFNTNRF